MSGVRSGLMEMHVFPQSFAVVPAKVQTQQGEADVMRLQFTDIGGTSVFVAFGMQDWAQFVAACKDPVAAALAAQARSRIVLRHDAMRPPKNAKR